MLGCFRRLAIGYLIISVPIPPSVKTSSSSECGILPSIICVLYTPPMSAVVHASTFGSMPPGDETVSNEFVHFSHTDRWHQRCVIREVSEDPARVCEHNEFLRLKRRCDLACHCIGINIIRLTITPTPIGVMTGI